MTRENSYENGKNVEINKWETQKISEPFEKEALLNKVLPVEMTSQVKEKPGKVYELWEVMEIFGRYQKMQYLYVCIATMFVAMTSMNYIFVAGDVNYRCAVSQCEEIPRRYEADWWPNVTIDRCSRPVLNTSNHETCGSFTGLVEPCDEWVYESNNTIVGELNLACQTLKAKMIGTIHNIGMLLSMLMSGWVSDRFGRKPAFIFFAVASCVGHLKTFATSYHMYAATEFVESMLSGGTYTAGMVLMIEIGGRENRVLAGILFAYATYFGESTYAIIVWIAQYWKTIIRIAYTPIILCLSFLFLVRESPRWQFLNGKSREAIESIEISAKVNKLTINKTNFDDIEKLKEQLSVKSVDERESYKTIFTSKQILLRLLVAAVNRFTVNFVYIGMMVNASSLPGNKNLNYLLLTLMSFPGEIVALYLMNRIGRKIPLVVGFVVCGLLCAGSGFIPEAYTALRTAMLMIGKILISACFTGAITYSMELFPTNARGSLLGVCAIAGRAGGMMAPLTPILMNISPALPAILFGGTAALSGFLITMTPETRDLPLMDTVEQMNASMRKKSLAENVNTINNSTSV